MNRTFVFFVAVGFLQFWTLLANAESLPLLYDAPKFEFTDQNGAKFNSSSLDGKIWIVDFKYTSCRDECPLMMSAMKNVQGKLKGLQGVEFVSFTTDPKRDSSMVLKKYMKLHKVDETNWHFLTGEKEKIVKVSKEGFKFPGEIKSVSHSEKFALVDRKGKIRAYYDSKTKSEMDRLVADVQNL